jgi:uncharacterized protein YndB with AHSA1/START domain/uncharacterized protein YciI
MAELPAIHREVVVAAPAEAAFALFTAHIGAWWPLAEYSVFGERGTVAFEGERVVERSGPDASVWAEVVSWDPPRTFELCWHPGSEAAKSTDLAVTFTALDAASTRVSIEQRGWERMADPAAAREEYGHGWPQVLEGYRRRADPAAPETKADEWEWFALMHRPGPALADGESIFAHPDFGEHVAFLRRLDERGILVAAGPLGDDPGAGMAVVRLRGEDAAAEVRALATGDDQAVVRGLLAATVRPWDVRFGGYPA